MGTSDKMLGVTWRWTSIQSKGSSNTPSRLHATETEISSGSVGQFGLSMALPLMPLLDYGFFHELMIVVMVSFAGGSVVYMDQPLVRR